MSDDIKPTAADMAVDLRAVMAEALKVVDAGPAHPATHLVAAARRAIAAEAELERQQDVTGALCAGLINIVLGKKRVAELVSRMEEQDAAPPEASAGPAEVGSGRGTDAT